MKLHFCTLFNSHYLSRGLLMYQSLQQHCKNFHLYVFAFDNACYDFLASQQYEHVTVISLQEFEDIDLLNIKPTRTATEYCWTCTPSTILYCIKTFNIYHCTYIDADLYFYADPLTLIDEMKDNAVLITEHRYTKEYDQSAESGIYCVQFITFKNTIQGMEVLHWWRNACIDWCYAKPENGKFGDQKYLDDWTARFKDVHVLQHLGGGIAPWNVQQYTFQKENDRIVGVKTSTKKCFKVIFFHFHGVKFYKKNIVLLSGVLYALTKQAKNIFYKNYIYKLIEIEKNIQQLNTTLYLPTLLQKSPKQPLNRWVVIKLYYKNVKNSFRNIFGRNLNHKLDHYHYHTIKKFID